MSIAIAIEDHYRPLGPNDRVPTDKVAVCVALADKLDSLGAFWAIEETPTGSSDPYGLRRSALGLIRIVLDNELRLSIKTLAGRAITPFQRDEGEVLRVANFLRDFCFDRLKVQLRDSGKHHDLVDAALSMGDDDLVRIVARVEALEAFLKTEDGKNLLAGYKRAANILAAEDKKGALQDIDFAAPVDAKLLTEAAEKALSAALAKAAPAAKAAVEKEDFAAAMTALAGLRAPVDAFMTDVLVNAEDKAVRANRLKLLNQIRDSLAAVADFSKIEG